jgi:hypothetical protein
MKFFSSRAGRPEKKRPSTKLHFDTLESRELLTGSLSSTIASTLALVPDSAVTDRAIQNGNWSDPNTWQNGVVPGANENVLIPAQLSVSLDTTTNPVHTVRVDGTLQFANNQDTNLLVDTLVVNVGGSLVIGTASNPIAAADRAQITFTSNGPIDTVWDPNSLSRGLISAGNVTMYGARTTAYVSLSRDALVGSTTLVLSQTPTNWQIGDEIVLGGTFAKSNQDETLQILGIQGTRVTVSPVAYSHRSFGQAPVYVTDLARNIVLQSQDQTVIGNRGHVMFLSNATSIRYVEFLGLDRTDKSQPINDPQLDANGQLIPGTGTNPRGRYAVNFYELGTDSTTAPAVVDGSSVVNSPGWGFVNHSSYVNFTNDVAFNVNGASFVTEAGDEIGSFDRNLAIHSVGTGAEDFYDPTRVPLQDWAHEGDGFWAQGNGASFTGNVAIGQVAAGYYYFNRPYTLPVQDVTPSAAPLTGFSGNLAVGCDYGAFIRYETNGGTIDNLTVSSCITGYKQQYCDGMAVQNSHLYGTRFSDYGIFLAVESASDFVARNDVVIGYSAGIRFSEEYDQQLVGGIWNNRHNIEIPTCFSTGRSITITNPTFVPSTNPKHYDIFWVNELKNVLTRNINTFFAPDVVLYNGQQLFAPWQSALFVPFPAEIRGVPAIPAGLIGKTNLQLLATYGICMGGTIAPPSLPGGPSTNGTIGLVVTYPTVVSLSSPWRTSTRSGYQLVYQLADGTVITGPTYTLTTGWNMLVVTVGGVPHAFFVYEGP